jgi:hypothetical protein
MNKETSPAILISYLPDIGKDSTILIGPVLLSWTLDVQEVSILSDRQEPFGRMRVIECQIRRADLEHSGHHQFGEKRFHVDSAAALFVPFSRHGLVSYGFSRSDRLDW